MKNILFVCTGNSARSIIAEAIVNNHFKDKYKAYSAGSNPLGKVNEDVKNYLLSKNINLTGYYSKNFRDFLDNRIRMDHVITVCNNANNEVCPIWPKNNDIIHWDIEDPTKYLDATEDLIKKTKIIYKTYNFIYQKVAHLIG